MGRLLELAEGLLVDHSRELRGDFPWQREVEDEMLAEGYTEEEIVRSRREAVEEWLDTDLDLRTACLAVLGVEKAEVA